MKQYKELFVLGDSHATPNKYIDVHDSFWGLLAKDISASKICNMAFPGISFESIVHVLTSEAEIFAGDDKLVIIGIPVLERFCVLSENVRIPINNAKVFNETLRHVDNKRFESLSNLKNMSLFEHGSKHVVSRSDRCWIESQILGDVVLVSNLLKSYNVNHMFVNLSKPLMEETFPNAKSIIGKVKQMENQIIFNDTLQSINFGINKPVDYDDYGYEGHHGKIGNKLFYEKSLCPQLKIAGLL